LTTSHGAVSFTRFLANSNLSTFILSVGHSLMIEKADEMKKVLLKLKEEAYEEIGKAVKSSAEKPTNEPSGDIYDQASNERDRELLLLLGDREREKVRNMDEALARLEEGEYGICEDCEEEIPLGRLKAMPFARLCVKCKTDLEKLQAQTKRFEEDRVYRETASSDEEES
jgi:DnaK suppressor protein